MSILYNVYYIYTHIKFTEYSSSFR